MTTDFMDVGLLTFFSGSVFVKWVHVWVPILPCVYVVVVVVLDRRKGIFIVSLKKRKKIG